MLIDTHCHFDLYEDPQKLIIESEKLGIVTIGMTNLPSHFKMGYDHVKELRKVRLALGMHPLMAMYHFNEYDLFKRYLDLTSYVGEIGLDFSREGIETKAIQLETFEFVLSSVASKKKILSIHSRKAEKECLAMLQKHKIKNVIFHWYSGGMKILDEIAEAGYYFSINTAMIKSETGKKIISRVPKELLLTETDGPFVQHNNATVFPKDVGSVLDYFNKHKLDGQISAEQLIEQNFRRLLIGLK